MDLDLNQDVTGAVNKGILEALGITLGVAFLAWLAFSE